jgi:hypothetical protein
MWTVPHGRVLGVKAHLRFRDSLPWREVNRRGIGGIHRVLAYEDQCPTRGEINDCLGVVARVDDGGSIRSEAAEVLRHCEAGVDWLDCSDNLVQ